MVFRWENARWFVKGKSRHALRFGYKIKYIYSVLVICFIPVQLNVIAFIWLELINANINKVKINIKNYEKQGVMNIYEEALT